MAYRTVSELNRDELNELKESFFWQCLDQCPEVLDDISFYDDIPDDMICHHYQDVVFSEDDFFCNR